MVVPDVTNCGLKLSGEPSVQYTKPFNIAASGAGVQPLASAKNATGNKLRVIIVGCLTICIFSYNHVTDDTSD